MPSSPKGGHQATAGSHERKMARQWLKSTSHGLASWQSQLHSRAGSPVPNIIDLKHANHHFSPGLRGKSFAVAGESG